MRSIDYTTTTDLVHGAIRYTVLGVGPITLCPVTVHGSDQIDPQRVHVTFGPRVEGYNSSSAEHPAVFGVLLGGGAVIQTNPNPDDPYHDFYVHRAGKGLAPEKTAARTRGIVRVLVADYTKNPDRSRIETAHLLAHAPRVIADCNHLIAVQTKRADELRRDLAAAERLTERTLTLIDLEVTTSSLTPP